MSICPHCNQKVAPDLPYCSVCGQPRMLDSLLARRTRPAWQTGLWNGLAILGVLMFLSSSSVAFLREAKAVRVAREALQMDVPAMNRRASEILRPFLVSHSDHERALFLAAVAGARIEDLRESAARRARLKQVAPDRLDELDSEIGVAIEQSIRTRKCDARGLLWYFDESGLLEEGLRSQVLTNIQLAARGCQSSESEKDQDQAYRLMADLVERGVGRSLIEETYLKPLRQAVDGKRFPEAERLSRGAARLSPETGSAVDGILAGLRQEVEASLKSVDDACRKIRLNSRNRVGRFWCFPKEPPSSLATIEDGWGRPLHYKPLNLDPNLQCYQGFEVASYGVDGRETAEASGFPDADMICTFQSGRSSLQAPDRFWRVKT